MDKDKTPPTAATRHLNADELRRLLSDENSPPIQASADGLVSVIMDARFHVRSVTFQGLKLCLEEEARLEHAVASAFNQAFEQVARRNAERLTSVEKG